MNKQESAHHLAPGTLLRNGRYYIGRVLGQGGFGITYLGWDNDRSERVAIKEYFPLSLVARNPGDQSLSFAGEEARSDFDYGLVRFMDEARVLASFSSAPSIVSILDVFQENSLACMVMEYLEGQDLKHVLSESGKRISPELARNVALHIIDALRDVHAQGLMHRDVSPDNIFITKDGKVKLIDFGAARFAFGTQNKSLSVVLKPSYAPVEQYQTRGNQGPWTDIYALGATLYRCVTGQLPPESLSRLEDDKLKPPSELGIELPGKMEIAILKALAVKAKDRFQSVLEFRDALLDATAQPQAVAAAPEKTRRLVTESGQASADQTVALDASAGNVDLLVPSGKAQSPDREMEKTAAPDWTKRMHDEPEMTERIPQTRHTDQREEKRSSGAKKWIVLAAVVLIVSGGAFWTYTAMSAKSETPEPSQPISKPDPIPKPPLREPMEPEPAKNEPQDSPAPDPDAMYQSGRMFMDNGDLVKAKSLLEQAAGLGHSRSMSALGFLSQRQGDQQKSYEWYIKAAAAGDNEAMMPLAQFYYFGKIVPKNYKKAADLLRPLADAGNVNAKIMLSNIFDEGGYGISRDPEEAARYRK
ncbi:MAG: protein kinase [Synergistaceae bacterium]|nr:protein kinase [Synergistaceae bacterium]